MDNEWEEELIQNVIEELTQDMIEGESEVKGWKRRGNSKEERERAEMEKEIVSVYNSLCFERKLHFSYGMNVDGRGLWQDVLCC